MPVARSGYLRSAQPSASGLRARREGTADPMEWLAGLAKAVVQFAIGIGSMIGAAVPGAAPVHAPVTPPPAAVVAAGTSSPSSKAGPGQLLGRYDAGGQGSAADAPQHYHGAG